VERESMEAIASGRQLSSGWLLSRELDKLFNGQMLGERAHGGIIAATVGIEDQI